MRGFGRRQGRRQASPPWAAGRRRNVWSWAKPRRGGAFFQSGVTLALFIAAAVMLMMDRDPRSHVDRSPGSGLVSLYSPAPDNVRRVQRTPLPDSGTRNAARAMPVCGSGKRLNCVVDGDTFWLDGEKVRIENINAPEVNGKCRRERDLAERATKRLSALLSRQTIEIERMDKDRYDRTLVRVSTGRGEIGGALIREGLARDYAGGRRSWCG